MTAKTKKPRAPRPKQQFIPGTEPLSVPEIDKAAEEYVDCRDTRTADLKLEIEAKNVLLALMKEHGFDSYTFDSYIVTRDVIEGVKVKRKKTEEKGDGED